MTLPEAHLFGRLHVSIFVFQFYAHFGKQSMNWQESSFYVALPLSPGHVYYNQNVRTAITHVIDDSNVSFQ